MTDLPPGWRLEVFETIDSTNAEAARRAAAGAPGGLALIASRQTAGRGRSGRAWSTEGSDLALSVLLRPEMPPAEAAKVAFVAALAVYDFAEALLPAATPISIKWPNDVMIGDAKLSGILAEASGLAGGGLDWLVVGIGVNLAPAARPADARPTDVVTAGGPRLAVEDAGRRLLACFAHWQDLWAAEGFEPVRQAWRDRARDLGRQVQARLPKETIVGEARDLAADGALVLGLADGSERRIAAGDVFPLARSA